MAVTGFSVGAAHIQVLPSIKGLHRDIGRQLRGVKAPSILAPVKPQLDKAAAAKAESEVRALSQRLAKARDVESDAVGRLRVAELRLQEVRQSGTATASQVAAAENRVTNAHHAVANAQRDNIRLTEQYRTAQTRASEATQQAERRSRGLLSSLRGIGTNLRQVDDSRLRSTLGTLGRVGGAATIAAGGIFALGSSVPALIGLAGALAQVAGAAGLLPAALGAGGLGIGALVIGSAGLADAFKPSTARAQGSAVSSVAAARRAADRALVASAEQVRTAEQALARAQQSARDAQEDLTRARTAAVEQLEDLQLALSGAQLGERAADIALRRARERLAQLQSTGATGLDLEEAVLGVDEAELAVREAADRYADLREEAAAAERAGVDGADNVVAAQRRVADATQGVQDAQHDLARAHADAAAAQLDAADALAQAQQRLADTAPTQLAASAAAFVLAVKELGPAWTALRLDVQERLFAGVAGNVRLLGDRYLPVLRGALGGVADTLNRAGRGVADFFGQPKVVGEVATELDNMRLGLDLASGAAVPFARAWHDIMLVGSTFLPGLGQGFAGLAERFATFISDARQSGELRDWIQGGIDRLVQLKDIVVSVGSIFGSVWSAAKDAGADFLTTVQTVTGEVAAALKTPEGAEGLRTFFTGLRGLVDNLRPGLRAVVDVVGTVVDEIAPKLPKAGEAFSALAKAFGPVLSLGVRIVGAVLGPLLSILKGIAPVLGPVTVGLLAAYAAYRSWLILTAIIGMVRAFIAGQTALNVVLAANPIGIVVLALVALAAGLIYAYNHSERFRTIVQAAWQGIQIAASWAWDHVIKPVFEGIKYWLTEVVGPAYMWLWREVIEPAADGIGNAISWAWDHVIKPAFDGIKAGIGLVRDAFSGAVDAIGRIWGGLKDAAAVPVNFVLEFVYNKGIKAVWDKIAGVVGIDPLPRADLIGQTASGGGGGRGPQLIAAGGAVLPGYAPGLDSVPALLSPGEAVLVPELTRAIGPAAIMAANAAASGRPPGGMGRFAGGGIAGLFTDPVGTLKGMFGDPGTRIRSAFGDSPWVQLVAGVPVRIITEAVSFLAGKIRETVAPELSGRAVAAAGSGVQRWSGVVLHALELLGQSPGLLPNVLSRMQRESGGNPTIVNLWDSNAQRGTPSVGLMQVIGPTFRAYAGPFAGTGPFLYGTSTNPAANVYAGLNYALHRYPSLRYAMDKPGGYDRGGYLPPGYSTVYNGTGRPEPVYTQAQENALLTLADRAAGLDGARITGTLDLGNGLQGYVDGRIEAANHSTGSAIARGRR